MPVNPRRVHTLRAAPDGGGPVLYWMSREQRASDNWGLLYARELAGAARPLVAAFCLAPAFAGAALRQYDFMLRGLEQTARTLAGRGIPLVLLHGDPGREVPRLAARLRAGVVVTDFDPLRAKRDWQARAAQALDAPLLEVDGHNVVPCRIASYKKEYAARTIRPRIHKLLPEFLEEFPPLTPQQAPAPELPAPDWAGARRTLRADPGVPPVATPPGEAAARAALGAFTADTLARYAAQRNDPNAGATSGLSPYLHFGQLAPQRAALDVAATGSGENQAAFLEELVVRRELADNFCLHSPDYDTLDAAPDWARRTLDEHRADPRPYLYSPEAFEAAATHDPLWNAAQNQMRASGAMHGYLRMYWAKKILEWSPTPESALATAIALNDRHQLDGRDPNGYTGILWSVAGLHDRPWGRRPVTGTIRAMTDSGCRRKFDVTAYIRRWGG
ncbi:deoxyribodipyrimidine photo-lyase [Desulfocurvus vexinensis]|uniref:deoxyribodipyrimidine photo-lyase n=1 Tax=Desulfocurvus vexinensis TaxID=399548 RepID=UPI00048DCD11|nr:deoxyribodipyrimidine photo-lyase [Desulfocurvus vexinensis]